MTKKRGVSGVGYGDKGEISLYAWEIVPKESDEGDRYAIVVELEMDGALREESGLVCEDLVEDEFGTVLGNHARHERAIRYEIELWGPRMGMGGVDAARSKETGGYNTFACQLGRDGIFISFPRTD